MYVFVAFWIRLFSRGLDRRMSLSEYSAIVFEKRRVSLTVSSCEYLVAENIMSLGVGEFVRCDRDKNVHDT